MDGCEVRQTKEGKSSLPAQIYFVCATSRPLETHDLAENLKVERVMLRVVRLSSNFELLNNASSGTPK